MTETEGKLVEVLRVGLKLRAGVVVDASTLIFGKEGLGLDSVDVLEIAVLLDKHFGVMLEEESAEVRAALVSVGTLAGFIDRCAGELIHEDTKEDKTLGQLSRNRNSNTKDTKNTKDHKAGGDDETQITQISQIKNDDRWERIFLASKDVVAKTI